LSVMAAVSVPVTGPRFRPNKCFACDRGNASAQEQFMEWPE
jgi:hypothetical protein